MEISIYLTCEDESELKQNHINHLNHKNPGSDNK